jgi:hypothetical protein
MVYQVSASHFNKSNPFLSDDPNFGPPEFYDAWQEHIRQEAKIRGRPVLEWQPQDGWGPLCKFLGKPSPPENVPFPKTNETAEIVKVKRAMYTIGFATWAAFGTVLYVGVKLLR